MRMVRWIYDRLVVGIPFGLLAYGFAGFEELAFRLTLGRSWPLPLWSPRR
jgi:hypothetical protein